MKKFTNKENMILCLFNYRQKSLRPGKIVTIRLSDFCEMNSKTFCIARVVAEKIKNIHISGGIFLKKYVKIIFRGYRFF